MSSNKTVFYILFTCVICLAQEFAVAQLTRFRKHDTLYYKSYPGLLTGRFYLSQKYTAFSVQEADRDGNIRYRPNSSLDLGFGVTYHIVSLNVSYGFNFLNKNDEGKGKTKYLDLQGHIYPNKWVVDWYLQFYDGYYLYPKGANGNTSGNYYVRPDINVNLLGLSVSRVFNDKKFSYRAALTQNEWQTKSAGSFLLGGEIYYGKMHGDSAFVPYNLENAYPQAGINQVNFVSFGPGGGYAYTLVLAKHFFITGSLCFNVNLGFSTEYSDLVKIKKTYINPVTVFKMAAGYNSNTWDVSVNFVGNQLPIGAYDKSNYYLQTGNYRLVVAKKLVPRAWVKKILDKIDMLYEKSIKVVKPKEQFEPLGP